jgi:hypothetical protein
MCEHCVFFLSVNVVLATVQLICKEDANYHSSVNLRTDLVLCWNKWVFVRCLRFCSLRDGRSGDRIPVGVTFSAPVQTDSGVHPPPLYNGKSVSFPGVKWPRRGVNHPLQSSAEIKGRVELYLYSSSGFSWPMTCYSANFTCGLYIPIII